MMWHHCKFGLKYNALYLSEDMAFMNKISGNVFVPL